MLRKFTKDMGRYRAGQLHDYPRGIWNQLERNAGVPLDDFTEVVTVDKAIAQSMLKGKPKVHKRLGATQ